VHGASDPVLDLGRKIAAEIDANGGDTLANWMAHHVAGVIAEAERAPPASRAAAKRRAATAILELWERRREWPRAFRPFCNLEAVSAAFSALDPDAARPYYRHDLWAQVEALATSDEVRRLLEVVKGVDHTARSLIDDFIRGAASKAASQDADWLAAASATGTEAIEIELVGMLSDSAASRRKAGRVRERLRERIDRLDAFAKTAEAIGEELKQALEALEAEEMAESKAAIKAEDK
jgi:hypothetical protein